MINHKNSDWDTWENTKTSVINKQTNSVSSSVNDLIDDFSFDWEFDLDFDLSELGFLDIDESSHDLLETVLLKYWIISKDDKWSDLDFIMSWYEVNFYKLNSYIQEEVSKLATLDSLPDDILEVSYESLKFMKKLSPEVNKKVININSAEVSQVFNEFSVLFDTLSLWKNYNILDNYNSYSIENISSLLDEYNSKLLIFSNEWKTEMFNIYFDFYSHLIDLLNRLCILNSNDIVRKKTIQSILEVIQFKTNEAKFNIEFNSKQLNVLNNFLWKFLINFTHINYNDSQWKDLDSVIKQFWRDFERQITWYELCESNDFWNKPENKNLVFYTFVWNASYLLLNFLRKVEINFKWVDLFNNKLFHDLIYSKFTLIKAYRTDINNLDDFKSDLIVNFSMLYHMINNDRWFTNFLWDFASRWDSWNVINHFILDKKDISADDMEIIHHLILFDDKSIQLDKQLDLLDKLLSLWSFASDNLEFFKLKTIDLILNKINRLNDKHLYENDFISRVINYIETHKEASNLLSMYSKLYLSLALYYSDYKDYSKIDDSKNFYSKFISINWYNLLDNEYSNYHDRLLINYWKYESLMQWQKNISDNNVLLSIWKRTTDLYDKYNEFKVKTEINSEITQLVNHILEKDWIDDLKIVNTIQQVISSKIFLWISKVYLTGINTKSIPRLNKWYAVQSYKVIDNVNISFVFPKFYHDTFNFLLKRNWSFISTNIRNIISWYYWKRKMYIDELTWLPNSSKLLNDLSKDYKEDTNTFYEVDLSFINDINKQYWHKIWDNVLKLISELFDKNIWYCTTYRLNGLRLWLLEYRSDVVCVWCDFVDNDSQVIVLINNIIKQVSEKNNFKNSNFHIWVWIWKHDDLLINSSNALSEAINKWEKLSVKYSVK